MKEFIELIKKLFTESIKKLTPCNHSYVFDRGFRYEGVGESYSVELYKCEKCLKVKKIKFTV